MKASVPCFPQARFQHRMYDATVKSLVDYLSVMKFMPHDRIGNFFKEVSSLEISQGSFVSWINEAKKNAAPAIEKSRSAS